MEAIQDSLKDKNYYNLIIKTKTKKSSLLKKYKKFDKKLKIDFLYNDGKQNYYEFFVSYDSIFKQEML
jgi:hypothetical protein